MNTNRERRMDAQQQYPRIDILNDSVYEVFSIMEPLELRRSIIKILSGDLQKYRQNILVGEDTKIWSQKLLELYDKSPRSVWHLVDEVQIKLDDEIIKAVVLEYEKKIGSRKMVGIEISKQYDASQEVSKDTSTSSIDPLYEELTGGDLLDDVQYEVEDFDWGKPLSVPIPISKDELTKIQDEIDILLVTAVETERDSILRLLKPYPNREGVLKVNTHPVSYLGKFGAFNTAVIMCEVGSIGLNSSHDAIKNGIHHFKPRAVIMVGIACGRSPKKQKIGDVLISKFLIPYDSKRVENGITKYTAAALLSDAVLRELCRPVHDWDFKRPDGQKCTVHRPGSILTGRTLLDNLEEKVKLFKEFEKQDPIGMEMEGEGLYSAAEKKVPWIVIKAISDWGDGKKSERRSHRDVASASSASFVHHVLSDQYALESLQ